MASKKFLKQNANVQEEEPLGYSSDGRPYYLAKAAYIDWFERFESKNMSMQEALELSHMDGIARIMRQSHLVYTGKKADWGE